MKTVDRLIIRAEKKGYSERLLFGLIYPSENNQWVADGRIGNCLVGSGEKAVTCLCGSIGEAENALGKLGEKYPYYNDIPIIVNDLKS